MEPNGLFSYCCYALALTHITHRWQLLLVFWLMQILLTCVRIHSFPFQNFDLTPDPMGPTVNDYVRCSISRREQLIFHIWLKFKTSANQESIELKAESKIKISQVQTEKNKTTVREGKKREWKFGRVKRFDMWWKEIKIDEKYGQPREWLKLKLLI